MIHVCIRQITICGFKDIGDQVLSTSSRYFFVKNSLALTVPFENEKPLLNIYGLGPGAVVKAACLESRRSRVRTPL